jgi:activator of HSP90 ATPase
VFQCGDSGAGQKGHGVTSAYRRRDIPILLAAFGAAAGGVARAADTKTPGLSHTADAIHQDVMFDAPRHRVYETLTRADLFDLVAKAGVEERSGRRDLGTSDTMIDAVPGGAFTVFRGYISGRIIELAPDVRLVLAWREKIWDPGQFSLATFALSDAGAGTKLAFDQTGFPAGAGDHLSIGWYENYWEPMKKVLAQ